MGSKRKREQAKPMKPTTRLLLRIAILVAFAFVPTCASMSVFPAATRVAAPLVCPSDTDHSVVTARWGGTSRGGSSLRWDLYCVTAQGHGTVPSTSKLVLALLAVWSGVVAVVLLLLRAKRLLLTDRRAPGGPANA